MSLQSFTSPHPNKQKGAPPQQLSEAIAGHEIQPSLVFSQLDGVGEFDKSRFQAASEIADEVFRSLWYPAGEIDNKNKNSSWRPLTIEDLQEEQIADCYGHTYLTSEAFDEVGIEHWVAYANGHAFLVVPPTESDDISDAYIVDPLVPQLNQKVGYSINRGTMESVENGIASRKRGLMTIDLDEMADAVQASAQTLSRRVFKRINLPYKQPDNRGVSKNTLFVSVFPSVEGRDAIKRQLELRRTLAEKNHTAAAAIMTDGDAILMDLDARQDHTEAREVVEGYCRDGDIEEAKAFVEKYFDNFVGLDDSRILEARGDIYRLVAERAGARECAEVAYSIYREAENNRKAFKRRIVGKLATTQYLLEAS